MIWAFERAMSRVLPPRQWSLGVACALAAVYAVCRALESMTPPLDPIGIVQLYAPFEAMVGIATLSYAGWRLWFHPAINAGYREWLSTTPWNHTRPLPLGPAHLVWQDLVVLGALSGAITIPMGLRGFQVVGLPFVAVYCLGLCYANFRAGEDGPTYWTLLALFSAPLVWPNWGGLWAIALTMIGFCWYGLRESLKSFPWEETPCWRRRSINFTANSLATALAGPMVNSHELVEETHISARQAIGVATLIAWGIFGCTTQGLEGLAGDEYGRALLPKFQTLGLIVAGFAAAFRLLAYCIQHVPPISTWGRLWTGRWIIPGYDKVLLAPCATVAVAAILPQALSPLGVSLPAICAATAFGIFWSVFGLGPSMREWHLTGQHRIALSRLSRPTRRNPTRLCPKTGI